MPDNISRPLRATPIPRKETSGAGLVGGDATISGCGLSSIRVLLFDPELSSI
jgi:hypothetical protein